MNTYLRYNNKYSCCGCSACANACPANCICMQTDEEGFTYPSVDPTKCLHCDICRKVCPFENENESGYNDKVPLTFAAKAVEKNTQIKCSSGGVFAILASYVLDSGGIVYGCSFTDDYLSCSHIKVDNSYSIEKLYGAKYFQSDIGKTYKMVQDDLNCGFRVLFSGTPCQVKGLLLFLRKEYDNLICIDIVCHGVPSQLMWKKYVEYLEKKYCRSIVFASFRHIFQYNEHLGVEKTKNEILIKEQSSDNQFYKLFLKNYCLRPSCYHCRVKECSSDSDITLGDFWGIEKVCPELSDGNGVSLVICNSSKGKKILDQIKDSLYFKETVFMDSIKYNSSYCKSPEYPIQRNAFYLNLQSMKFDNLCKMYCKNDAVYYLRGVVANILNRIRYRKSMKHGILIVLKHE